MNKQKPKISHSSEIDSVCVKSKGFQMKYLLMFSKEGICVENFCKQIPLSVFVRGLSQSKIKHGVINCYFMPAAPPPAHSSPFVIILFVQTSKIFVHRVTMNCYYNLPKMQVR